MPAPVIIPALVALGSTLIGSYFQNRTARIQAEKKKREEELAFADKVYNEVSAALDSISYNLTEQAIYVAVRSAKGTPRLPDDQTNWESYQTSLRIWKSNVNHMLGQIRAFYGDENAYLFQEIMNLISEGEGMVGATYYSTANSLVKIATAAEKKANKGKEFVVDWGAFFDPINSLPQKITQLNTEMVSRRQKQEVGTLMGPAKYGLW